MKSQRLRVIEDRLTARLRERIAHDGGLTKIGDRLTFKDMAARLHAATAGRVHTASKVLQRECRDE